MIAIINVSERLSGLIAFCVPAQKCRGCLCQLFFSRHGRAALLHEGHWLQVLLCLVPFRWPCWSKVLVCLLWCPKSASPSSSFLRQWLLSCPCLLLNTKVRLNHTGCHHSAASQHCEAAFCRSVSQTLIHPFISKTPYMNLSRVRYIQL